MKIMSFLRMLCSKETLLLLLREIIHTSLESVKSHPFLEISLIMHTYLQKGKEELSTTSKPEK